MEREPWLNYALLVGDGDPDEDNVIAMTKELFWLLPSDFFAQKFDDLTEPRRLLVWKLLGREGPPPRIRILVNTDYLKRVVERVIAEKDEAKLPLVDRVQALLDSYKTNKQRQKRIKALDLLMRDNDGYGDISWLIERFALQLRMEQRRNVTAKEVQSFIHEGIRDGRVRTSILVDGERVEVPQEVIDRNPPPA